MWWKIRKKWFVWSMAIILAIVRDWFKDDEHVYNETEKIVQSCANIALKIDDKISSDDEEPFDDSGLSAAF
ncbi:hypothetical protein D6779_09135 [Candidatus Parcubacteria bacterium]|nr:MAG: hypothetical protein D6779_09135 [Candidatus Parcubacteria bacterium]